MHCMQARRIELGQAERARHLACGLAARTGVRHHERRKDARRRKKEVPFAARGLAVEGGSEGDARVDGRPLSRGSVAGGIARAKLVVFGCFRGPAPRSPSSGSTARYTCEYRCYA